MLVAPVVQDVHEDVLVVLVHVQHLVQGHVVIALLDVVQDVLVDASLAVLDARAAARDAAPAARPTAEGAEADARAAPAAAAEVAAGAGTRAVRPARARAQAATAPAHRAPARARGAPGPAAAAAGAKEAAPGRAEGAPGAPADATGHAADRVRGAARVAQVDAQGDVLLVQDVQVLAQEIAILLVRMDAVQDAKHLALVVPVVAQDVLLDVGQDVLLLVLLHAVQRVIRNVQEHVMVLQAGNVLIKKGINMKRKFEIPEDVSDYLQRLSFEKMSREDVIDRIITSHKDDPDASVLDSVVFNHYMKALIEVTAEYEQAKRKVPDYFPDDIDDATDVNWTLDFDTYTVTIDA